MDRAQRHLHCESGELTKPTQARPANHSSVASRLALGTRDHLAGSLSETHNNRRSSHETPHLDKQQKFLSHQLQATLAWVASRNREPERDLTMHHYSQILVAYVIGGLTFIPLCLLALLIHAYLTFPIRADFNEAPAEDVLLRPGDRADVIKSASKGLDEKFKSRGALETDVAAGYFAVCREYTPGGINGKPPERITPTGATTVTSASPSVYQSMYRSIFDRKKEPSPFENKGAPKPPNKGGNVFYIVLR